MALKKYQDRLRRENGKEVVYAKVKGDAGRLVFDSQTLLGFFDPLVELNHSQKYAKSRKPSLVTLYMILNVLLGRYMAIPVIC